MGPVGHTIISAGVGGGVWAATGSPTAGGAALAVGVLVDVDHLYDFYNWYIRRRGNKLHVLFHGWEYSIAAMMVLGLLYYHPVLLAAAVAHLVHVTTDHFHNGLSPFGYSILYRIWVRFDAAKLAPGYEVTRAYRTWIHLLPLGHLLQPWFRRKIEPWIVNRLAEPSDAD